MIEINLLPEDSRPVKTGVVYDPKQFLFGLPVILFILIIAHFYITAQSISVNKEYSALNKKWKETAAQREALKSNKDKNTLSNGTLSFAQASKARIAWAQKLALISTNLPQGVWLNELIVNDKNFTLKGSVVSADKQEMGLINDFLNSLKQDKVFFSGFLSLELGPVQREMVGATERVDFTFSGQLK